MADPLIPVPSLSTRSSRRWVVGTAVALVVGGIVMAVLQPANAPFVVGLLVLLGLLAVVLGSTRVRLDTEQGTLVRTRWPARTRRVKLAAASDVRLVDNRGGGLNLTVRSSQGTVLVPVLLRSVYVEASQPPDVLRPLADVLERHAPRWGQVVTALRAQATHLEQGGDAASSPFADLTSCGVTSLGA